MAHIVFSKQLNQYLIRRMATENVKSNLSLQITGLMLFKLYNRNVAV